MKLAICFVLAYLIGSIPSGVWIGRGFFHKDIRASGSHNIGTTNAYRVLGPIGGTVVLAMDILKGTLGASLPALFGITPHWWVLLVGLAAVFGHAFSIFIGFKGGKAVATSAGICLAYSPLFFAFACVVFISLVLLTSMVSIASTLGMAIVTIGSLFMHDWPLTVVCFGIWVLFMIRHKDNFARIKAGKENMVPFGLGQILRRRRQAK
ncbi:glycerol-3-phosphate 1-O-acyltransferase PlsY [Lacticaseibacillus parakribbianus]|uniref:glycerol-3-phosphate 1-O-acyltransferase PlsY n=1 Tax=Lacticaseibacillus parakribbianus TaxID=2970927 RepID=UPI0021CB8D3C|nr:glycerol-3-phosphate 1-O-acyltransferase PlsY [Lacticaseibacillus parakribbianus]